MDFLQKVFSGGDQCFWLCIFFLILCNYMPQTESTNVIAEQADIMKSYMDVTANPCNDFYQYACGNWETVHKVPEDKEQFGTLQLTELEAMNDIEELLKSPDMPANVDVEDSVKKAKQFYASCINTENIEKLGKEPLKKMLDDMGGWPAIDSSSDNKNWLKVLVETRKLGEQLIFYSEVSQDLYNSTRNTLYAYHPYLGLKSRHDFEEKDGKKKKDLVAYEKLIAGILKKFGVDENNVNEELKDIVKFETDLAAISTDSSEINATMLTTFYNPAILKDLIDNYNEIDWVKYYSTLHNKDIQPSEIIIASKDYLKDLNVLIKNTNPKTIINYLLWRIVQKYAPFVGSTFKDDFEAFNKETVGITKPTPRNEECIKYAIEYMSAPVGYLYVQKYFNNEAKKDTKNLLDRLKKTFRSLLENNNWLDADTKKLALEKLEKMGINIGYPDQILEPSYLKELYKDISIKEDDFFSNIIALIKLKNSEESKKIGQPIRKDYWEFGFLSANAYYPYPFQAIFITALMFRPPLYHTEFPEFLNYGLLGSSISFGMGRAFDNLGIMFDKNGDSNSWFSNASLEEFTNRAKCFINQYSKQSRGSVKLNGDLLFNTAIADDVGLKVAFIAYKEWIEENKKFNKKMLPEFDISTEKLFFLSFAQLHCNSIQEEAWASLLANDNHALANYRVNTVLSNSKYFAETFQCSSNTAMANSTETCEIW